MVDEEEEEEGGSASPLKLDDGDRSRIRCRCFRVSIKPSLILGTFSCCSSPPTALVAAVAADLLGIKSPSSKAC